MGGWIADHALEIGYALTWASVLWYAWRLEGRARRAGRRLARTEPDEPATPRREA